MLIKRCRGFKLSFPQSSRSLKIGIISDLHNSPHIENIVLKLGSLRCDALVCLGDLPSRRGLDNRLATRQIRSGIEILAGFNGTVYVIPGNYETVKAWNGALYGMIYRFIRPSNIVDCAYLNKPHSINGYDMFFIPGTEEYTDGFKVCQDSGKASDARFQYTVMENLEKMVTNPDKTVIFCHNPPLQEGDIGTDVGGSVIVTDSVCGLPKGYRLIRRKIPEKLSGFSRLEIKNCGSAMLRGFVNRTGIKKVISGHHHSSLGGFSPDGGIVAENTFVEALYFNPGAAKNGRFGIINLMPDGLISYEKYSINQAK